MANEIQTFTSELFETIRETNEVVCDMEVNEFYGYIHSDEITRALEATK